MDAREAGRIIGERQAGEDSPAQDELTHPLTNYAESSRVGDWSLRSALMRFAQPEPVRAGQVLELVRRLDTALHPAVSTLEKRIARREDASVDVRVADLAMIVRDDAEALVPVVEGFEEHGELADAEKGAIALLAVALEFDDLANTLASWALDVSQPRPNDAVDATCAVVLARLDVLGVPSERGGPPRGRRDRGV